MREIKFNVWDVDNNRMFRDCFSLTNEGTQSLVLFEKRSSENLIWLQYTGLKDKNGVEIYEGDIVKAFDNINKYTDPYLTGNEPTYSYNKFVEFLDAGFSLSSKKHPNGGCGRLETYRPNKSDFLEVIGNIHENPELLNN